MSVKRCAGAFCSRALSINSMIRCTALSPGRRSTRMTARPSRFVVPPLTGSPTRLVTGNASPVRADSSAEVAPSVISPSTGKRSPGLTSNSSPTPNESVGTSTHWPCSRRRGRLGRGLEERADRLLGPVIRKTLERVAEREKKKEGRALRPGADPGRAERDHDHEEVDVELAPAQLAREIDRGEPAPGKVGGDERAAARAAAPRPASAKENRAACKGRRKPRRPASPDAAAARSLGASP